MKRLLIAVLLFSSLNLSAGMAKDAPLPPRLPQALIIGDSISLGYTPSVIKMLENEIVVEHHQGNAGPTMRGIEHIDQWLGDTKWDVIHFNWGLWDMYGWQYEKVDRSPAAYAKRLDALVLRLKKTGAQLLWATTTPICPESEVNCEVKVSPETERQYHDAALRIMEKHNVKVNDLHAFMSSEWDKYSIAENNVHFTKEGYRKLAEQVANHIRASLADITVDTVKLWSQPYRNWHYYPDHVIPGKPNIKGFEKVQKTDVPTVFQLPGDQKWYMTFIGFDGKGYQSFLAESDDLIHWSNMRLAMGYGPKDSFDYGGVVLGAFLYEDYDIKAPRTLKKKDSKYYSLYGAYPRQGGYELRPGYEGVASSADGFTWRRAKDEPILSVHQPDCGAWEKSCIYQPWLVEHKGKYYNFYNAANGSIEQMGLATSHNLLEWKRYEENPVIPNGPKGDYNEKFSSDGKVFWDEDHWVNFFFGVGRGGAHIMAAFSRDLTHWTVNPDPLYKAGGNPSGLDKQYAHKISLVWNPANETYYMFYNAVGDKGRGIGLITSKPLVN